MTAEEKLKDGEMKVMKPRKLPVLPLEETIRNAMREHSKPRGLPKDWSSRIFK